jgi:enoyl-CoA hydratase
MSLPSLTDVIVEKRSNALWVTLDRPKDYNAITAAMLAGLDAAMDSIDADHSLRAMVITGAGRAFCAGADLKGFGRDGDGDPAQNVTRALESCGRVFSRLEALRVPTIAAVNGIALAGGLEMLLCCDLVVADEAIKLGDGHARYAQLPGGGGTVRLPRRIGAAKAKYLMFSAEAIPAAQALEWGLVDAIAPTGQLTAKVDAMLQQFQSKSSLVLERMKWLAQQAAEQPLEAGLKAEISMCAWHVSSHDRNEGLAAFAAKRVPEYVGR